MTSKNQKVPIQVPVAGVRKDIHPLSLPPTALERGQNVLVQDGALRPRPAHDNAEWVSEEGWVGSWQSPFEGGANITAIEYDEDDEIIVVALDNGDIVCTDDAFATTSTHKCPNRDYMTHLFYMANLAGGTPYLFGGTSKGRVYYYDMSTAPPMTTAQWKLSFTPSGDGEEDTALYGMTADKANGQVCIAVYNDDARSFELRYYVSATTWTSISNPGGHFLRPELGYGGHSTSGELWILATKDSLGSWNYELYSFDSKTPSAGSFVERSDGDSQLSSFVGDTTNDLTGAVKRGGLNSAIVTSDDRGATWSTSISGTGDPDALIKLFYSNLAGGSSVISTWEADPDVADVWYAFVTDDVPAQVFLSGTLLTQYPEVSAVGTGEEHGYSIYDLGTGTWKIYLKCTHGDPDIFHAGAITYGAPRAAYLAIGSKCYQSDDLTQWTEYTPPPFDPPTVAAATSDGSRWYIGAGGRVWIPPLYNAVAVAKPQSVHQLDTNLVEDQIVMATQKGWLKLDSGTGTWTNITEDGNGLTGASRKSRTVFRGFVGSDGTTYYLLGTNGVDIPKAYKSGESPDVYTDFTGDGLPSYAKAMCISANRVVLANGPEGSPYGINCSDPLDFNDGWDGLGVTWLADTQGPITALLELNPIQFTVFKTDAIYHGVSQVEFQGVAAPFRYELVKPGIIGPPAPHCVLQTHRGEQLYLGHDGGVYLYDGMAPQDIGKHVRQIVEGQCDFDNIEDSWGMIDNIKRLAYFFYPTTGGAMNRGVCINLDNGAAWEVQLPPNWNAACGAPLFYTTGVTWDEMTLTWDEMNVSWDSLSTSQHHIFFAIEADVWYKQRWDALKSYTDGGIPIHCVWRPGWALLGEPDRYATLHGMKHLMSELAPGQEFFVTAYGMDDEMVVDTGAVKDYGGGLLPGADRDGANDYESQDTLTTESMGYTTEFAMTAQRFTYEVDAQITRRFSWSGALARFKQRGYR